MRIKPLLAASVLILSTSLLAGCTTASPQPSSTTTAPTSTKPTATAATADGKLPGDTAVGSRQYITDAAGKYETVELAPNASALDPKLWSSVEPSAKKIFSTTEIDSGVKYAFEFAVNQGLDSIALDGNEKGWVAWKRDVAPKYIFSGARSDILADNPIPSGHIDRSLVIYNDEANVFPTLVRDGKPRFSEIAYEPKSAVISGDTVTSGKYKGLKFLGVTAVINAKARATNAQIKASALALNKGSKAATEAQLLQDYPSLKDGKQISNVTMRYAFAYYLVQDEGKWQIGGFQVKPDYDIFGRDLSSAPATN
jgi:hypothetical protein